MAIKFSPPHAPGMIPVKDISVNYFENFYGRGAFSQNMAISNATLSIQAVNVSLKFPFNKVVLFFSKGVTSSASYSFSFGLYSLNGGTLSLTNSASASTAYTANETSIGWTSLATSTNQMVSPGTWYFGVVVRTSNANISMARASSVAIGNADPFFIRGRMTVSTAGLPSSIATSDLDITGSDVTRQTYVIVTA